MLLPDDFFKTLRTVFTGKNAVAHRRKNLELEVLKVEG